MPDNKISKESERTSLKPDRRTFSKGITQALNIPVE